MMFLRSTLTGDVTPSTRLYPVMTYYEVVSLKEYMDYCESAHMGPADEWGDPMTWEAFLQYIKTN